MQHPIYVERQLFKFLWIFMPLMSLFNLWMEIHAITPRGSLLPFIVLLINLLALLALGSLTIRVDATHLSWCFGWLGWPVWKVALADIEVAGPTNTSFLDGWGIQRTREGMLYNAHGKQAIRLGMRNGKSIRLGTQDPQRLLSYLTPRLNGR
ncbi:hypothetical protein ACO0LM_07175 [Undibacterium sp. Di26W]|uniref:hypothetical protein n=1 Tax=Undibacterium sp. Di26W TaxID=3413035 RepID=UPI003BF07D70